MKTIKIFLASSEELRIERLELKEMIEVLNKSVYHRKGIDIDLFTWEAHDCQYRTRAKQEEYNEQVRQSDIFVGLFFTKAGKFTQEEFGVARETYDQTQCYPVIFVFFKEADPELEQDTLLEFRERVLREACHYPVNFTSIDKVKWEFTVNLLRLEASDALMGLKVEKGQVMLENQMVCQLDKIPFAAKNPDLNRLKAAFDEVADEIGKTCKRLEKAKKRVAAEPTDEEERQEMEGYYSDYSRLIAKKQKLEKDIEEQENNLMLFSLSLAKEQSRASASWLCNARDLFEQGDVSGAMALLREGTKDAGKIAMEFDTYKEITAEKLAVLQNQIEGLVQQAAGLITQLKVTDRYQQAYVLYERAISLGRGRIDGYRLVDILFNYAYLLQKQNQFNLSLSYYEEALSLSRTFISAPSNTYLFYITWTLNNLGVLHSDLDQYPQAEAKYQEALKLFRGLAAVIPDVYLPDMARTLNNLGILHKKQNHYPQAEAEYQESLEIYRRLAVTSPETFLPDIAGVLNNLGFLHSELRQYPNAEAEYQDALEIYGRLATATPDIYLPYVAIMFNNLGILHKNLDQYSRAEVEYQKALEVYRCLAITTPDAYLPYVAGVLNNLGVLHKILNQYPQAEAEFREALEVRRRLAAVVPDAYLPDVAMTLNNLGNLHEKLKQYLEAEVEYQEALIICRRLVAAVPDVYYPYLAQTLNNLGILHYGLRQYLNAEAESLEALDIYRRLAIATPDAYLPFVAMTLSNLGALHSDLHQYSHAEAECQEVLHTYRCLAAASPGAYLPDLAGILNNLGNLCYILEKYKQACIYYKESIAIYNGLYKKYPQVYYADFSQALYWAGITLLQAGVLENEDEERLRIEYLDTYLKKCYGIAQQYSANMQMQWYIERIEYLFKKE